MKLIINKKQHENSYFRSRGYNTTFKIADSICKTHFKELMKLSKMYDAKTKEGFILDSDLSKFEVLKNKIENSNDNVAKKSHEKSIKAAKERIANKISFEDFVEDHLDQHLVLMNDYDKKQAYESYINLK